MENTEERPLSQVCEVPCKAIANELREIAKCVKSKVPIRLFIWIISGLSFLIVVIIGGTQWTIVDRIGKIEISTALLASEITETRSAVNRHEIRDEDRTNIQDERIRDLELRESARHPGYYMEPNNLRGE